MSAENLFSDPLERLLKDAVAQQARRKANAVTTKSKPTPDKIPFNTTFTNPENWTRSRGLALIHKSDTGLMTLLGNFGEYVHNRVRGVRKLLREDGPISVDGQEIVTGAWWLTKEVAHRLSPSEEVEDVELSLDVILPGMGVHCQEAKLAVRLLHNAFFRVELAEQTRFIDPENNTFLFFPAGLDILDGLSYTTKLELRKKLDLRHTEEK